MFSGAFRINLGIAMHPDTAFQVGGNLIKEFCRPTREIGESQDDSKDGASKAARVAIGIANTASLTSLSFFA